ncbi:DNA adenine methylase [Vibrio fluvialis]|nr:DNA adenine methylase [Vibrio fluvialis]MBY7939707.1 DNA adenine methylase [Vibrio fluvialis]MBY8167166.1 DNA adenine methylase [Vibrio fluvialis]
MTQITSPAMRYHGAKFRLAPWVISHFPNHRCYVEPFGGAAGVLLRKEPAYAEVYNDIDDEVVNLFQVLRDEKSNLALRELCALTPYSRKDFELAFESCDEPVEKARRMVVRATMGFGSASATKGNTGFRTDTKRRYATAMHLWSRYPENLAAICERLQSVLIENKPAVDVMKKHDAIDTLHYCDPPYVPESRVKGNRYYQHEMTEGDHEALIKSVSMLNGMIVLSGYESDLYNDCLQGWKKEQKSSRISAGRGTTTRIECLWLSPSCSDALDKERAAA